MSGYLCRECDRVFLRLAAYEDHCFIDHSHFLADKPIRRIIARAIRWLANVAGAI